MTTAHRRILRMAAPLLGVALLATSCGGKSDGSGEDSAGEPVRGGSLAYGIEAETEDGWCLPESQLAISGITIARSIYDPLVVPDDEGGFVPYLAESVSPNDDHTVWTITVREGVTFHDGTALTAEVVKNNLDAYRGFVGSSQAATPQSHPTRSPLLFRFAMADIDDVQVTGDLQVTITTTRPWVDLPATLYGGGRLGIMAESQIRDTETCDSKLVGTGPFKLDRWIPNQELTVTKNVDYWQEAPDGEPYPYLDEIRFVPIPETEQRVNALEAGDIDVLHNSRPGDLLTLQGLEEQGVVDLWSSAAAGETSFVQMNNSVAPFDDVRVRRAMAMVIDREDYKASNLRGQGTIANGPFPPGSVGYVEDSGYPEPDLAAAKELIAEYEAEKGEIGTVTFTATSDAFNQQTAIFVQQALAQLDITVAMATVQQSELVSTAIAGSYEMMPFRFYGGGVPDYNLIWWYTGGPTNFPRIADPEIDRLMDEGRGTADPKAQAEIYEDVNRQFGENVWILPLNWVTWTIASQPTAHGYTPDTFPTLPAGGDANWTEGLTSGHPLHGIWVDA